MKSRIGMPLCALAIGVAVLLFASGVIVGDHQAYAYYGFYHHTYGVYHHWWHHYWWHPWMHYRW